MIVMYTYVYYNRDRRKSNNIQDFVSLFGKTQNRTLKATHRPMMREKIVKDECRISDRDVLSGGRQEDRQHDKDVTPAFLSVMLSRTRIVFNSIRLQTTYGAHAFFHSQNLSEEETTMVREVRYAWDDEENELGLPDRRDHFDDLDDPLLDPYLPNTTGTQNRSDHPGMGTQKDEPKNQPNQKSERRHLADADWLSDNT